MVNETGVQTDLATWLLDQLRVDEESAQRAAPGPWHYCEDDADGEVISDGSPYYSVAYARGGNPRADNDGMAAQNATGHHIAAWDPARVLAECDVKRRIIELHAPEPLEPNIFEDAPAGYPNDTPTEWNCRACQQTEGIYPCPTLRLMAAVYADRPGYRADEWSPDGR